MCSSTGGGGDIPCRRISESTNSGATQPALFLINERTHSAGLAEVAHEKQWSVAGISWRTSPVHHPALMSAPPRNATGTLQMRQHHFSTSATSVGNELS